jgi:hypothetical protein
MGGNILVYSPILMSGVFYNPTNTTPSFILTPICKKKFWKNFWEIRMFI